MGFTLQISDRDLGCLARRKSKIDKVAWLFLIFRVYSAMSVTCSNFSMPGHLVFGYAIDANIVLNPGLGGPI